MRLRGRLATGLGAALSAVLLAAACTGGGDTGSPSPSQSAPTTSPTSASPSATPTGSADLPEPVARRAWQVNTGVAQLNAPDIVLVVSAYGLYRSQGHLVALLGLEFAGDVPANGSANILQLLAGPHPGREGPGGATDGLALVDPAAKKAYPVARTADGGCVCSVNPRVTVGKTSVLGAMFAAPPEDVRALDVVVPHFGVLPGVPISDSAPPSPTAGPSLDIISLQATPPPATAPVVDLVTPVANRDLSVTRETGRLILAADVLFAFDRADLTGKAKSRIAEAAGVLRKKARGTVRVNGYTDGKGSQSYNQRLSRRRAGAVRDALAERLHGSGLKLVPHGYGEKDPVAPNTVNGKDYPQGRKLNRRVEIRYHERPEPGPEPTAVGSPPVAQPSGVPTPGKPLATKKMRFFGQPVRVEVYGIARHGSLATLTFAFANLDDKAFGVRNRLARPSGGPENDVTGVYLADRKRGKVYLPARFKLGHGVQECACSYGYVFAMPGQTQYLYATYAAPPRSTARVDVHVPHVGTFKGIPIS